MNLVAYAYDGEGIGSTAMLRDGFDAAGKERDSDGGYVQATYVVPTGTKLGISYGESSLDETIDDIGQSHDIVSKNEMFTVGAYHPLTKHLNLVAEYSKVESHSSKIATAATESDIMSVGAILFF
jgi:hypothetical protein